MLPRCGACALARSGNRRLENINRGGAFIGMWRRGIGSLLAAVGLGIASASACLAGTPAAAWDRPMQLGVDISSSRVPFRGVAAASLSDKCGKWRRIADRLGETFAGLRLRQSVVARTCAFAEQAPPEETVWSWPWARGEIDGELPPRLHGHFGAWTIRCGASGRRERCALVHETEANIQPGNGAAGHVRMLTHFVIDEIGGHERVLWRLYVDRAEPHWFADASSSPQPSVSSDMVRAHSGAVMVRKTFDDCGRLGCLMEAEVGAAARVATRLSDGGNLQLDVRPAPGLVLTQTVPAAGFRPGLSELQRLKRQEQRAIAVK